MLHTTSCSKPFEVISILYFSPFTNIHRKSLDEASSSFRTSVTSLQNIPCLSVINWTFCFCSWHLRGWTRLRHLQNSTEPNALPQSVSMDPFSHGSVEPRKLANDLLEKSGIFGLPTSSPCIKRKIKYIPENQQRTPKNDTFRKRSPVRLGWFSGEPC